MPILILPGGTDVAEMALFALDSLPKNQCPDAEQLDELERQGQLVRMPTGADGGYLLHAYVDEPVPPDLLQFCSMEDKLTSVFRPVSGNVAFGGLESTYQEFKANDAIRSDGIIMPGSYALAAYHTDFPDDLVDRTVNEGLSTGDLRFLAMPGYAIFLALVSMIATLATGHFAISLGLGIVWYVVFRFYLRSPRYLRLQKLRSERQLSYPSIIVDLRSHK